MDTLISIGATTAFVLLDHRLLLRVEPANLFCRSFRTTRDRKFGPLVRSEGEHEEGSAVRELLRLQPETAEVLEKDGSTRIVPSLEVRQGLRLVIRPGGRIAVDGVVLEGSFGGRSIDCYWRVDSHRQGPGDRVVAGSINTTGRLIIESNVDGRHTTITRIAQLVQKAQSSLAPRFRSLQTRSLRSFRPF